MRQKLCFFLVLLLIPLFLLSCTEAEDFLSCLDGDFVCLAEGTVGGKPFSATVYSGGKIVYASPDSLTGIIASEDGKALSLGSLSLPAGSLSGLFLPATLICESFEVTGSGTERVGEQTLCYVDGTNEEGARRVYVEKDGTPCRIVGTWRGIKADFAIKFSKTEG